jgi:outer membrane immunogenic protein
MKRAVLAFALTVGPASAALPADLPMPAAVPPIYARAIAYDWTGLYVGGNLGLGWNGGSFADSIGNTFSVNPKTLFLGGAQVGFNYEFGGGFLVGAEADLAFRRHEQQQYSRASKSDRHSYRHRGLGGSQ